MWAFKYQYPLLKADPRHLVARKTCRVWSYNSLAIPAPWGEASWHMDYAYIGKRWTV